MFSINFLQKKAGNLLEDIDQIISYASINEDKEMLDLIYEDLYQLKERIGTYELL